MPNADHADHTIRPDLIDLRALAEKLGVTERHIRRLVAERRVPFIKWGHLLRFDPVDIDRWIDEHRTEPSRRLRIVR